MADEPKNKVNIEDLPEEQKELMPEEAKKVKGGIKTYTCPSDSHSVANQAEAGVAEAGRVDEETRMKGDLQMQ